MPVLHPLDLPNPCFIKVHSYLKALLMRKFFQVPFLWLHKREAQECDKKPENERRKRRQKHFREVKQRVAYETYWIVPVRERKHCHYSCKQQNQPDGL